MTQKSDNAGDESIAAFKGRADRVEMPATIDSRLALFSNTDDVINRLDIDGRWLCGRILVSLDMDTAEIVELVRDQFGKEMLPRNVQFYKQFFNAIPSYEDVMVLRANGFTWTDIRIALPLAEKGLINKFLDGVRSGLVTQESAAQGISMLADTGELPQEGSLPAPAVPEPPANAGSAAADEIGSTKDHEALVNAKRYGKTIGNLSKKLSELSVEWDNKIRETMASVPKEERHKLLKMLSEMQTDTVDIQTNMTDFIAVIESTRQQLVDDTPDIESFKNTKVTKVTFTKRKGR